MPVRYTDAAGTAAEWAASALILAVGQHGYDTTNRIGKIGDGQNLWANLPVQVGSSQNSVSDIVRLSQVAYDALSPKSPTTLYLIV